METGNTSIVTKISIRRARALAVAALAALTAGAASAQLFRTYEDTTSGPIPNGNTSCATSISRTFTVPETFTYNNVAVGLTIAHGERGDVRAYLTPPGGTRTLLFAHNTGDNNDNYDILLTTRNEGGMVLNDDDVDPTAAPFYNRLVYSSVLAAAPFTSGNAGGTWTIELCDRANNGVNGTLQRAHLVLGENATVPATCQGTVALDWATLGTDVPFTSTTVGGITISQGPTADFAGTASNSFIARATAVTGNQTGYYRLSMDADAVGGTQADEEVGLASTFTFSRAVRDLSFTFLDVDITTNAWEDQIELHGQAIDGSELPHTLIPVAGANAVRAGDWAEGNGGNSDPTDTTGNVGVTFRGDVASFTISYTQGNNPTDENNYMFIGISDFSLCAMNDWGDAPASYDASNGGARHQLSTTAPMWLGARSGDGENAAQAGPTALDDDVAPTGWFNDEDGYGGVGFPACPNNGTYTVPMTVNNLSGATGYLVGYIDWNRDGDFADANEVSATVAVPDGTTGSTVNVVWSSVPSQCGGTTATYARFRLAGSALEATSPTGLATTGEVEDYRIDASTLPVTLAHLASERAGEAVTVRWTTASEWANAGFSVLGRAGDGEWIVLGFVDARSPDSTTPQRYAATFVAPGVDELAVEDVSLFGETRRHGPFAVGESVGDEPEAMPIDWAAVRREVDSAPAVAGAPLRFSVQATAAAAKEGLLLVRETGIHRVTHEQLVAAGIDLSGTPAGRIALSDNGKAVARYVGTTGGTFGPGSFVEFVAQPVTTLASPVDAYVLSVARKESALPGAPGAGGAALGVTSAEDVYAPDRAYSFSAPNGDPWYDQGLLARGGAASLTRTFDLPDLAAGAVTLTVEGWGYGDWPQQGPPDHHVVAVLNGTVIADDAFDGIAPWERTVDVTSLVTPAGNTLEIRVPGDTGYQFDYFAFEGFSVRYERSTVARDGRFAGAVSGGGFSIAGFGDGEAVAVWRTKGKTWQRDERAASGGRVAVQGGGTVWASSAAGLLTPEVSAGVPAPLDFSTAEYVIVTHPAFAGALGDLVALEEGRGLATEVVTVDRIYSAYSDHVVSADAVKRFLTTSATKRNLKYVLLVGADTTDPHDHLGLGSMTFVPTAYLPYVPNFPFSPTDEDLVDRNGDGVGEVPIGRLPVRTVGELQEVVAKIRTWEQNVAATPREALLVAGGATAGADFRSINLAYHYNLGTWTRSVAHVDETGVGATRTAVLGALNAGTPLVSYVGHSSTGQWNSPAIFKWQDIDALANAGRPNLVVQWGCWNAYYVDPSTESLAGRLLRTAGVGAAAAIGATTLTTDASHQALGTLFFAQIDGAPKSLGDAFRAAKVELLKRAAPKDALLGMALLGDPAMSLPR